MIRYNSLTLIVLLFTTVCHTQSISTDPWIDYASDEYEIYPNIVYSTANNTDLKLDLYLPKTMNTTVPALLLFHGGGWVEGQKERNVLQLLPYLSLGWVVINVEYRLARNSLAPAAVEDCRCALRWLVSHAKEYNVDTSKIVLTGGSAGGHLALMTGMLQAQSAFDRRYPTDNSVRWNKADELQIHVAAIINWYGITDVADLLDGPSAKHYAIEWFGSIENRKELAKQLSPINYVRPGLPPIISIQGSKDDVSVYDNTVKFHAALDSIGVPNKLVTIQGAMHGGFSRQSFIDSFAAIREFLRKNKIIN